jgi:hypothetical protein
VKGRTLPRLYTPPLPGRRKGDGPSAGCPCRCALSSETSDGFEVIAWAKRIGIKLNPWQRWLLIHGLELDAACEGYRFRVFVVLVARQNGKTLVKMVLTLWRLYVRGVRLCVGTAQDLSQAREVMNEGLVPLMLDKPALSERFDPDNEDQDARRGIWHKTLNDEYFRLDSEWRGGRAVGPHGPRYLIKALNRRAGRGLWDVGEVNIDELREQTDFAGWSSISKVVMAAEDAQIWCMSNAGDSSSLLLNHLRSIALAGTDPAMFHAEWSAEDGCELDDPKAWAQANPSLGYTLPEAAIRSALATDPPAVFRTEVLCQFVGALNAAVDPFAWAACVDAGGSLDGLRDRLAVCVEAGAGGHVAAIAAAELPDDGRVRFAVVGSWPSMQEARRALPGLRELWRPKALGWFPAGPGAALSASMRKAKAVPIKGASVAEACMTFGDYVKGRRVLQPDDPLLTEQVGRTSKVGTAKTWEFDRSNPEPIERAFAAAGALYLALDLKRPLSGRRVILPSDVASSA